MALDLTVTYGIQVLSGQPGYPYGKARNVTVSGDGTGTPWEAALVNEWFGFSQALLINAGITPSGSPESALASDYLAAVKYATQNISGDQLVNGSVHATGTFDGLGFVAADGNSIGGGHNFLGLTSFVAQIDVTPGGIVVGPGGVAIGNGLDGILIQVGGLTILAGAVSITPPADFAGTVTVHDELIFADTGRIREKVAYAPNADHTFTLSEGSILVAKSTISAPRTWTLPTGNEGNKLTLLNYSTSIITLHNAGGGSLLTVPSSQLPAATGGGTSPAKVTLYWLDNGTYVGWSGQ